MDAFVTGTLPQKRQSIKVDVNKQKSGGLGNTTVVISILALQSQKEKALSIRSVLFVAKFWLSIRNVLFVAKF